MRRARACSRAASGGWSRSGELASHRHRATTRTASPPGRPLILGGVEIPRERGLDGHSDADVLAHAVIDALLGAAGLGDIGQHFPDTDPALRRARTRSSCCARWWRCWRARAARSSTSTRRWCSSARRSAPYREAIRDALAGALRVGADRVNVKATTGEGMGFIGREEGVAAMAVATLGCD